ncbi:DUF3226 domain-containing protein [Coleofasciculus sp. FACHB-SPT9]|uniref:DUF3226 domain-containing protein n=1 Tax=Cyanophyceae TaxID=3028117 RepID=UPI0016898C2F|nr:DUF3226 domain-containing protein [Coleofasciculus sp. FACHB-SPT9]MBD1891700.1 hypothetical protein [Coleofasciculus sp. FACHB-SPT9]
MPLSRKPPKPKPQQLLVEGKNDRHVIWALCEQHKLPETFSVEVPQEDEDPGIEALLMSLPLKLKQENLRTLGIVVDADQDLLARWQAVRDRLSASGYKDIPKSPPAEDWIYAPPDLPRVGVWLMPDNQIPGILEDFVAHLIPQNDALRPKAEAILQEIEQDCLNCYTLVHRPKALIHSWLAWQQTPGMPMGQAITAQVLRYDCAIALIFVAWLKLLFELPNPS